MINFDRDYDVSFNEKGNYFEFYPMKEHFYGVEENIWSVETYLLGLLYNENGNFVLKVLNGVADKTVEEKIGFFENISASEAIDLSKEYLNLFLI